MSAKTEAFLLAMVAALAVIFIVWQVGKLRAFVTTPHLGSLSV